MFQNTLFYLVFLAYFAIAMYLPAPATATIAVGQVDDFEIDDNEWGPFPNSSRAVDQGPGGTGDGLRRIGGDHRGIAATNHVSPHRPELDGTPADHCSAG